MSYLLNIRPGPEPHTVTSAYLHSALSLCLCNSVSVPVLSLHTVLSTQVSRGAVCQTYYITGMSFLRLEITLYRISS